MRHEDVYYTCDNCGLRLTDDHTVITVTNTDPAAVHPTHEYHLCAPAWLEVSQIVNKHSIESNRHDVEVQRAMSSQRTYLDSFDD